MMNCRTLVRTFAFSSIATSLLLSAGCASMHPDEDPNRSYFDGGALQEPDPMTIVLTGRVLRSQGRLAESEYILRRVISEYPDYAPAYSELGELLIKDGRTSDAIRILQEGVVEIPGSAFLLNDLGMCLLVAGDYIGASDRFHEAMDLDPAEATYTANLAMVTAIQGEYDEAIAIYSKVMPVAEAHANVAELAQARGDLDRAEADRAIAGRPLP